MLIKVLAVAGQVRRVLQAMYLVVLAVQGLHQVLLVHLSPMLVEVEVMEVLGVLAVAVQVELRQQREQQILAVAVAVKMAQELRRRAVQVLLFFPFQLQNIQAQLQAHQQSQQAAQIQF
jgi:hypothetical protein